VATTKIKQLHNNCTTVLGAYHFMVLAHKNSNKQVVAANQRPAER